MSQAGKLLPSNAARNRPSGRLNGPLPAASPVGWSNFNYTVIAVVAVLGFAGVWWLVPPRNWFTGPRVQGSAGELAAIESELELLA
jgi:hypothetical protein